MTDEKTVPDPWANAPDGTMPPFLSVDERENLIKTQRVVYLRSIRQEDTTHGRKWYADIMEPTTGNERTCSFTVDKDPTPRNRLLGYLRDFMAQYELTVLPVILVRAGQGYMFGKPPDETD